MEFIVKRDPPLTFGTFIPHRKRTKLPIRVAQGRAYYCFWARNALYLGLQALGLKAGDSVLLPAYHCATAVEPFLAFGAKVNFYNVSKRGQVDLEDVQAKIHAQTKALLVIHYFGLPQFLEPIMEICRTHGLKLIEDCAHVLEGEFQGIPLGGSGDISVFSWRKFLPVYDGGLLVVRDSLAGYEVPWTNMGKMFELKAWKNIVEKFHSATFLRRALHAANYFSHCLPLKKIGHVGSESSGNSINNYRMDFNYSNAFVPMTSASKQIASNSDFASIVERRRQNVAYFRQALKRFAPITLWWEPISDSIGPWALPILVDGFPDVHLELRKRGIEAFTWGGVIHPTLPLENFPDAKFLYENLVLLPVHQGLTDKDKQYVIDNIGNIVNGEKGKRSDL